MGFWRVHVCVSWRPFRDCLRGPVPLLQNRGVGQYQVTSHRRIQTAAEQLFLIIHQSLTRILTSANLLFHTRGMLSAATYARISVNECPLRVRDDVLSICRETARLSDICLFSGRWGGGGGREPSGCEFFHHPRQRRSHLGQPPRSPQ